CASRKYILRISQGADESSVNQARSRAFEGFGGADEDRTHDLLNAIQALSQTELRPHSRQVAWLTPRVRQNSGGCYHEPAHAQAQLRQAALGGSGVFAVRPSAAAEGPALRGARVGFAAAPGRRTA